MFPSLVNCCTIDWFTEWPGDALEKVATKFLEDMDMDDEVKTNREKNQIHMYIFFLSFWFFRYVEILSKCVATFMKQFVKLPHDIWLKPSVIIM